MTTLDQLRYPVGRLESVTGTDPSLRGQHIQTLRQLPDKLSAAVAGLDETQLDTPYREGGWTVRQVVHHVADSHMNAYIRFRLALTEDWPTIKAYQEAEWAKLKDAHTLPVEVSLRLLEPLHHRWVVLLESLGEEDFSRGYRHPVYGEQSLGLALASYDWHSRHHTAHVTGLRKRMGW